MADSSPLSTPKRKRPDTMADESPSPLQSTFSFNVNSPVSVPTSGSSSPRTKVAHRFRGLALSDHGPVPDIRHGVGHAGGRQSGDGVGIGSGGGGGVASAAAYGDNDIAAKPGSYILQMNVDENESMMRKRTKISPNPEATVRRASPPQSEIPETPLASKYQSPTAADPTFPLPTTESEPSESAAVGHFVFDQAIFTSSPRPSPSKLFNPQSLPVPSDRPVETVKTRVRKRAGTPPLVGSSSSSTTSNNETQAGGDAKPTEITDPIRAALTWHEDEITVYDPEDEDDDGVGINGIGFRPTPAIAYARTMKRRQQLADYRKREEREARARRNLRRRGSPERPVTTLTRTESAARKVRFTEAESSLMIETV